MVQLFYKYDLSKNPKRLKIKNKYWHQYGGQLLAWLDHHLPDYPYVMKFVKNSDGKVIPNRPITLEFKSSDAILLITLMGIDLE